MKSYLWERPGRISSQLARQMRYRLNMESSIIGRGERGVAALGEVKGREKFAADHLARQRLLG